MDTTENTTGNGVNMDELLGTKAPVAEEMEEEGDSKETANDNADKTEKKETKDAEPDKKVLVEHGAFHEERERRKEYQRQLVEEKARNDRIEERQNKLLEALANKQAPEQQQDFTDPFVKLETEFKDLKQTITKSKEQIEADNKVIAEEQKLTQRYRASVDAFTKDKPDFMDARTFLINDKVSELKALGYDDMEIANEIKVIEKQIAERAYSREQNPADIVYKLAEGKGYKKAAAENKKTVEDIDKGLKASKSLTSGGKVSGSEETLSGLSADDLRDMSTDEFNALYDKLKKQSSRR